MTAVFFYVLMLVVFIILKYFLIPDMFQVPNKTLIKAFEQLFWITMILHAILCLKDPGYLVKDKTAHIPGTSELENFIELLLYHDSSYLCFECKHQKTPRSRHCF
jgi:hypothetical protein